MTKNKNIKIILNLNEEWKKENNVMEGYPQSTLLIKEDFYNKLKESNLYDELINRFIDSEKWVKNNPQLTAEKCEKFKITVNKDTIDELINVIEEKDKNKKEMEINKEIKLLKEIILENNKKIEQNKKEKKINKILSILKEEKIKIIKNSKINNIKKFKNKINKTQNKIISVVGIPGVGKSIFISLFSKNIKHKKILIIDFDIYNKSLDLIFGYNTKVQQEKAIIKINNNIDLLSKIEIFFKESYIEKNKIKNILDSFSKKYDFIIIDNTSEYSCEHTKEILKKSDSIIFLSDANLIELNKTKKLLEKYVNKWKIEKERINVVFNKININSINNKILNNLFSDFNILGKINFSNKYNLIINNNLKILNKKINKEYINIIKKMKIN